MSGNYWDHVTPLLADDFTIITYDRATDVDSCVMETLITALFHII